MSRVGTVNFTEQVDGDTFLIKSINFFASDGVTPLDLTDATPKVQIRRDSYNGKLMKTATIGDGLAWVSQVAGTLQFGGIDTVSWDGAGDYYYDLQLTYATSGIVRTYLRGKIVLIDDATAA